MENENKQQEVVEKPKRTKKKTTPKKKSKAELRKILRDSEAVVINNLGMKLKYEGIDGFELELLSFGDSEIVEIEELRKMHVKKKAFFNNYWILITDIICDDETIELKDVYEYIGIGKLYEDFENPDGEFFEELLLETSLKEFKATIKLMNKALIMQLFIRAQNLYEKGKLDNYYKIKAIEDIVDREDCFQDIKVNE